MSDSSRPLILDDERVSWLRQKVSLALEIPAESFDSHFIPTLSRAQAAVEAAGELEAYLSSTYGSGNAIFFSARKVSRTYPE
mgnify:CR=1 FL=1